MADPVKRHARQRKFLAGYRAFLEHYSGFPSVRAAAKACGIDRSSHTKWMRTDPNYRAAFADVQEEAAQACEDEAVRRAIEGVSRPVLYKGKPVRTGRGRSSRILYETEYSDQLLVLLLKRFRPALYREQSSVEVSGSIDIVERLQEGRQRVQELRRREQEQQKTG